MNQFYNIFDLGYIFYIFIICKNIKDVLYKNMPICFYHVRPINIEFVLIDDNKYIKDIKDNIDKTDENISQTISLKNVLVECPICLDEKKNEEFIIINCGHEFCIMCFESYLFGGKNDYNCAYCRTQIENIKLKNRYYYYKFKINIFLMNYLTDEIIIVYRIKALAFLSVLLIITGLGMLFSN
jgi:hypothetical protein